MSESSVFLRSLLQIPYFASLAEQNGTPWISELFRELEVRDFDFSTLDGDFMGKVGTYFDALEDNTFADAGTAGFESGSFAAAQAPAAKKAPAIETSEPQYSLEFMNTLSQSAVQGRFAPVEPQPATTTFVFDNLPFDIASIDHGCLEWSQYIMMIIWALRYHQENMFGAGTDNVVLNGADAAIELGGGDDRIYLAARGESEKDFDVVTVDGGGGSDTLYLYRDARHFGSDSEISGEGFTVRLDATNDFGANGGKVRLSGIENVFGSNHADNITGNDSGNLLFGRGGNDVLSGEAGGDTILGGDGDDTIDGGAGNDTLSGGAGKDKIVGGAGKDTVNGGADDDTLYGNDGDDTVRGGAGNDIVDGSNGDDTLFGNDGADTLYGGEGDDILVGGAGADKLNVNGSPGSDTYKYLLLSDSPDGAGNRDIVMAFDVANDVFDFTDLTDDPAALAATLSFVGTAAFSNTKGEVRYEQKDLAGTADDRTIVQIDDNGDGTADFEIELEGLHTLTSTNFDL